MEGSAASVAVMVPDGTWYLPKKVAESQVKTYTQYNVPDLETHGLSFSNVLLCPLGGLHIGIVKGLVVFAFKTMP